MWPGLAPAGARQRSTASSILTCHSHTHWRQWSQAGHGPRRVTAVCQLMVVWRVDGGGRLGSGPVYSCCFTALPAQPAPCLEAELSWLVLAATTRPLHQLGHTNLLSWPATLPPCCPPPTQERPLPIPLLPSPLPGLAAGGPLQVGGGRCPGAGVTSPSAACCLHSAQLGRAPPWLLATAVTQF